MQFMILNYVKPHNFADRLAENDPDGPAWGAYTKALLEAGVMVGGAALSSAHTATTVRVTNGRRELHDGPYAETKEQLGGFYLIDVPDLDTALAWAARNPAASSGAVEVRPLMQT
ncbi:MAG: YciI family protein [Beijerinckiaceae bacterium]|nr:YciI family protein [Beijerinckiaceae bacterium]